MSDLQTPIDRPYAQQPETRAAALRFLERTGNADVAAALGLVDADTEPDELPDFYRTPSGYFACRACKQRTRTDGVCRRADCHRGSAK